MLEDYSVDHPPPAPVLRRAFTRVRSTTLAGHAGRVMRITQLGGSIFGALLEQEAASQRDGALALQRLCSSLCKAHGWHVQVFGELPPGPAVLVANHSSYLDPLVLCGQTACCPIAKEELAEWPLVGKVGAKMAVNFVRRGDAQSGAVALRRALSALQSGVNVLNFPEGTTTSGRMLRFQRGIFGVARLAGVPVVPIGLSFERRELAWLGDDLLLPHYARTLRSGPCIVRLKVGARMSPHDYPSADAMAKAARSWIHGQLERVWPDLSAPQNPEIRRLVARKLGLDPSRPDAR